MKILLLIATCIAIPLQNIPDVNSQAQSTDSPERSQLNYLSPTESFQFTVNCEHLEEADCIAAKSTLDYVGNLIANEILIRNPITINVSFSDPAGRWYWPRISSKENYKPVVAQKVIGQDLGQILQYPFILAKQVDLTSRLALGVVSKIYSLAPPDLNLEVNNRANWNFQHNRTTIGEHKFDFASNITN